jgi:uncharacterized membrane protein
MAREKEIARCPQCGSSLPAGFPATCPHCGADLGDAAKVKTVARLAQTRQAVYDRNIRRVITAGLLLAVTALLSFTPIGFIPVPTPAGSATIAHIPTIIGGILEGPVVAVVVGLGFGLGSMWNPAVPVKDPLVVVLPRLFIGVTAWLLYRALRKADKRVLVGMLALLGVVSLVAIHQVALKLPWLGIALAAVVGGLTVLLYHWIQRENVLIVGLALAGVVGSLTNTVLVLSAAIWRQVPGITPAVALGIGLSQGIPEAIVSAIVVVAVVAALQRIEQGRRSARPS